MSFYIKDLLQLSTGVRRFLISEAFYGIGIGLYTLVLNLHLLFRGLREDEIGALVSMGILIMGVLAIPVSLLANRTGRKKTAGYRRILYRRRQCAVCRQR